MKTILVCGGRDYANHERVFEVLDKAQKVFGDFRLIEGGAYGADHYAAMWASKNNLKERHITVKAEWDKYGKAAGCIRNQHMLDAHKIDLVIAFPGGRGTADMISRAKKALVPVTEIT